MFPKDDASKTIKKLYWSSRKSNT